MLFILVMCTLFLCYADGQSVSAICGKSGTAGSFRVTFKYDRDGTTAAIGLESYDASENPNFVTKVTGSDCSTSTLDNDILTITYSVDTTSPLQCGVKQDGSDTSVYKFAISPDGVAKVYTFECDMDALQIPKVVEIDTFHTEHVDAVQEQIIPNAHNCSLGMLSASGMSTGESMPLGAEVSVGEPVKLRLTCTYAQPKAPTSRVCGKSFHLSRTTAGNMIVHIFTNSEDDVTVSIKGNFPGTIIDISRTVKLNNPVVETIPVEYIPTGDSNNWSVTKSGILIEANDLICVRAKFANPVGIYVVYPDNQLGTYFRLVDYMSRGTAATKFFITATKDGTVITMDLSGYPLAGLTINGLAATSSTTVSLDALETLTVTCDDCSKIIVNSTENITVVISDIYDSVYSINQIPNIQSLDTDFIYLPHFSSGAGYLISTITPNDVVTYSSSSVASASFTDELDVKVALGQLSFSVPVYSFQFFDMGWSCKPSIFTNLGKSVWSTQYEFDILLDGTSSRVYIIIVSQLGEFGTNLYAKSGTTDSLVTAIYQTGPLPPPSGSTEPAYHYVEYLIEASGHYIVYTKDVSKPFYLMIVERAVDGGNDICFGYLPFDNPLPEPPEPPEPCIPMENPDPGAVSIATSHEAIKDENLNLLVPYSLLVDSLLVSDNSAFTGDHVEAVHGNGCNLYNGGDTHGTIGSFTKNTACEGVVMETTWFRAYRFVTTPDVYFRVTIGGACFGGNASCIDSCTTNRRKRDLDDGIDHFDFNLRVNNNTRYGDTKEKRAWRCTAAKIYWLPHVILFLIIVIEVITTAYFLYVKYRQLRG